MATRGGWEIARAMCTEPVLLCLDEPAAGLNPRESHDLNQLLIHIRNEHKIGILLIEHDMTVVMEISDHIVVLDYGRKISDGSPEQVRADPAVIRGLSGRGRGRSAARGRRRGSFQTERRAIMLTVRGVNTFYGNIQALRGVNVDVHEGEIVALIGANGAGKSTLLMTICGNPRAARGQIDFEDANITQWPTHRIVRLGIAQSPEGRRIFPHMTVMENLQMGATTADPQYLDQDLERVFALFPILAERRVQRGGTLSGGEQQMLAIGRALMSRPRLLLLDEPSLGLAPILVRQIFSVIREINEKQGMTIFLVEQNAYHALRLAHRGYVMANGNIVMSGTGTELLNSPEIRAAYLEGGTA